MRPDVHAKPPTGEVAGPVHPSDLLLEPARGAYPAPQAVPSADRRHPDDPPPARMGQPAGPTSPPGRRVTLAVSAARVHRRRPGLATLEVPYRGDRAHLDRFARTIACGLRVAAMTGRPALEFVTVDRLDGHVLLVIGGDSEAVDHWLTGERLVLALQAAIDRTCRPGSGA